MSDWEKKEHWHKRGNNFLIEVKHWRNEPYHQEDGGHRWAVYVYVYPEHPLFKELERSRSGVPQEMPLHCGESFYKKHLSEDQVVTSVQVGADYNHDGDTRYTHMAQEEAGLLLADAEELFRYMLEYKEP